MQILRRFAIFIFALWLAPNNVFAGNELQNGELIEKSGIAGELKAWLSSFGMNHQQQGTQTGGKFEKAWADAVAKTFDAKKILMIIDKGLQEHLTAEDKDFLLAHYNSPLGSRITELETKASQPEAQAEIDALAQELKADPGKHADRMALYEEIAKAASATTLVVPSNVALPLLLGPLVLKEWKDLDAGTIRSMTEQQRSEIEQRHASTMALMAYTYQELEVPQLQAYLTFLSSAAAQKFNLIAGNLLVQTLLSQSEGLGKELHQNLGRKP